MSVSRAIRNKCLDCCCGSRDEVENCTVDCNLHPWRLGDSVPENKYTEIVKKCMECSSGDKYEVQACEMQSCPLWKYRLGYTLRERKSTSKK